MMQGAMRRVAEQRIREAQETGQFDHLPGAGKPLPDINEPVDDLWWVRQWARREGLSQPRLEAELRRAREAKKQTGSAS